MKNVPRVLIRQVNSPLQSEGLIPLYLLLSSLPLDLIWGYFVLYITFGRLGNVWGLFRLSRPRDAVSMESGKRGSGVCPSPQHTE